MAAGLVGKIILGVGRSGGLTGSAPDEPGVLERIDVAVEHLVDVADGQTGAKILHHAVRCEDVAADLAAEVDVGFGILEFLLFSAPLVHLVLIELGAHLLEGAGAVLDLRALVLALDHKTCLLYTSPS